MDSISGLSRWDRVKANMDQLKANVANKMREAGRSMPSTEISKGPTAPIDSVNLSPLAGALTGNALTLFNKALGDKDRAKLAELVGSGAVQAEEVSKALVYSLKHIATMDLFAGVEEPGGTSGRWSPSKPRTGQNPGPGHQLDSEPLFSPKGLAITNVSDAVVQSLREEFLARARLSLGDFADMDVAAQSAEFTELSRKALEQAGPDKVRYLHTPEEGGVGAVAKLGGLGVKLGLLNDYGDAVRTLIEKGEISYS